MNNKITKILKEIIETSGSAFFYTPAYYEDAISYVFTGWKEKATIFDEESLKAGIEKAELAVKNNQVCFGVIPYETSFFLSDFRDKTINKQTAGASNSIPGEIYFFKTVEKIQSADLEWPERYTIEEDFHIENFNLNTSREEYIAAINKIKNYISEGDTYQVNYTIKSKLKVSGSIIQLFIDLAFRQSARYTAICNTGKKIILSFSPELFFEKSGNSIFSHPMKGTQKRGFNIASDLVNRNELTASIKDQAENIMIVDLIRNDMSRIPGVEQVTAGPLFKIEQYESLFQMISVVNGRVNGKVSLWDVFKSLFPCGSITGAPKIRTMEIIKELEKEARGLYTGTIFMGHENRFTFNIPIRTIEIDQKTGNAEMGIGSGVVWDSDPVKEYEESLLKGQFFTLQEKKFYLFESVLIEHGNLVLLLEHLERLKKAAQHFLFIFDAQKIHREIEMKNIHNQEWGNSYLRIMLYKWGHVELQIVPFSNPADEPTVALSEIRVSTTNVYQYFKTSRREMYTTELQKYKGMGFFDVLFLNEKSELTEGSFSNVFLRKGNIWYTPPIESGILNGVYRDYLLKNQSSTHEEKILYQNDLIEADEVMLTNAVRKSIRVKLA